MAHRAILYLIRVAVALVDEQFALGRCQEVAIGELNGGFGFAGSKIGSSRASDVVGFVNHADGHLGSFGGAGARHHHVNHAFVGIGTHHHAFVGAWEVYTHIVVAHRLWRIVRHIVGFARCDANNQRQRHCQ